MSFVDAAVVRAADARRHQHAAPATSGAADDIAPADAILPSLASLPHAIIDEIIGYLSFLQIGSEASTCRFFAVRVLHAAEARRQRLGLTHVPVPARGEPVLCSYRLAEALATRQAAAQCSLGAGEKHSLLVLRGTVQSWGSGLHLGHEAAVDNPSLLYPTPTPIRALDGVGVVAVSAGLSHSVALTADGQAWSWGYQGQGALGHGVSAMHASNMPAWVPRPLLSLSTEVVVQVSCSERHTLLLSREGYVYSCGDGLAGQLGHGDNSPINVPRQILQWQAPAAAVSASTATTAAATTPATTATAAPAADATAAAAAPAVSERRTSLRTSLRQRAIDGELEESVESPHFEVLGRPPRISCVSAGEAHSLAVGAAHGHAYSWGLFAGGRLGLHKDAVEAAFPSRRAGDPILVPMHLQMPSGSGAIALVAAGESHSFAVDVRGALFAWGRNKEGALGTGSERDIGWRPARVRALSHVAVRAVAAGTIHSAAVSIDGEAFTWGIDSGGRLGHGDGLARALPARVEALVGRIVVEVAVGREHTLFRLQDGAVLSCGRSSDGVLGLHAPPDMLGAETFFCCNVPTPVPLAAEPSSPREPSPNTDAELEATSRAAS